MNHALIDLENYEKLTYDNGYTENIYYNNELCGFVIMHKLDELYYWTGHIIINDKINNYYDIEENYDYFNNSSCVIKNVFPYNIISTNNYINNLPVLEWSNDIVNHNNKFSVTNQIICICKKAYDNLFII